MEINKNSTSILLVEQNASEALKIAHRGYVFSIGEIVLKDTGKNLLSDEGKTRGHILKYELFEFEKGQSLHNRFPHPEEWLSLFFYHSLP